MKSKKCSRCGLVDVEFKDDICSKCEKLESDLKNFKEEKND